MDNQQGSRREGLVSILLTLAVVLFAVNFSISAGRQILPWLDSHFHNRPDVVEIDVLGPHQWHHPQGILVAPPAPVAPDAVIPPPQPAAPRMVQDAGIRAEMQRAQKEMTRELRRATLEAKREARRARAEARRAARQQERVTTQIHVVVR